MTRCISCDNVLSGRQSKFCSRQCKNRDTNNRHQSYCAQQRRGRLRKIRLLKLKGMRCERCGYSRNSAGLEFHHKEPEIKSFQLDLRSLSNRKWSAILTEADKCALLCSNCHAEEHNPNCELPAGRNSEQPDDNGIPVFDRR